MEPLEPGQFRTRLDPSIDIVGCGGATAMPHGSLGRLERARTRSPLVLVIVRKIPKFRPKKQKEPPILDVSTL